MNRHLIYDAEIPAVEAFLAGGKDGETAIYRQLVRVASFSGPARAREFALRAARAVAEEYCTHGDTAPRILDGITRASRLASKDANGGHNGLCGKYQADVIAAVDTQEVVLRYGDPYAHNFRKQVSPLSPSLFGLARSGCRHLLELQGLLLFACTCTGSPAPR